MTRKSLLLLPFPRISWTSFVIGAVLGIFSQRIPELRAYTEAYLQPIERSELFQQLKNKISSYKILYLEKPSFYDSSKIFLSKD